MKTTRYEKLYTPSGERLAAEPEAIPWDAYPRPTLRRDSFLNLNGWWAFTVNDSDRIPEQHDRTIRVPYCPESLLSGVGEVFSPDSRLWYRREISLPHGFKKERVLLHVGAADQVATVYVNGRMVGQHTGGYDPFSFDITEYLQENNVLDVRVVDRLPDTTLPYGKQCHKRGGMWYTPVSGIWQTVWLESVPEEYVQCLAVITDEEQVSIYAEGVSEGVVTVKTPDGTILVPLQEGRAELSLPEPRLWCPEDPYLYEYVLETATDRVESYFAVRTLDVRHVNGIPRMCLNGKPVFFHGVLDQGYWSDGLFTPPLPTCYEWDIRKMQELGFNTLRKHIKVEAEQFYYDCDRLGMLVWQDMVNNGDYSFIRDTALPTIGLKKRSDKRMHSDKSARQAFIEGMEQTVIRLNRHPCVVGWTIFNEGWGQFEGEQMYGYLRLLDNTRFIDTASGWFKGGQSDVVSEHVYFKPYRFKPAERPVFLSEFGGYSYKTEGHVFNTEKTYGYRKYTRAEDYMNGVETLYCQEIVPAVEQGLCGAIYTQLSDVEDETNGLYSYDRRVCKVDPERMQAIAQALTIRTEETE